MVASFLKFCFVPSPMFTQAKERCFRFRNVPIDAGDNFNSPVERRVIVIVLYRNLAEGNYSLHSSCLDNRY